MGICSLTSQIQNLGAILYFSFLIHIHSQDLKIASTLPPLLAFLNTRQYYHLQALAISPLLLIIHQMLLFPPLGSSPVTFNLSTPSPQSWSFFFSTYIPSSLEGKPLKRTSDLLTFYLHCYLYLLRTFGHTVLTQCCIPGRLPLDHVL